MKIGFRRFSCTDIQCKNLNASNVFWRRAIKVWLQAICMIWKKIFLQKVWSTWLRFGYRKFASKSMSLLVAHQSIFRMFMKGKFYAYVLWPLAKSFQNWIADWSAACSFQVDNFLTIALRLNDDRQNQELFVLMSEKCPPTSWAVDHYDLDQ